MRNVAGVWMVVCSLSAGCGWFASEPVAPPAPEAPAAPLPEIGESLGSAAMVGLIGEINGVTVLTACDGVERVRVLPVPDALAAITELGTQKGPTYALLRGDRRRRTVEDLKAGVDGALIDAVLLDGRPAKDGDCALANAASHPTFDIPRDGTVAYSDVQVMRVLGAWKLAAELPEDAGLGRSGLDALKARLVELTLGWCDGAPRVRIDGYKVDWTVTGPTDAVIGKYQLSCGRVRNAVYRTGKGEAAPLAATLDGAPLDVLVPELGLDHPDRVLGFGAWALSMKPVP